MRKEPKWIPVRKPPYLTQEIPKEQTHVLPMTDYTNKLLHGSIKRKNKSVSKETTFLTKMGPKERDKLVQLIKDLACAQERENELNSLVSNYKQDLDFKSKQVQELQEEKLSIQETKGKIEDQLIQAQHRLHEYEQEIVSLKSKILKKVKTHSVAVETIRPISVKTKVIIT